MRLRTVAGYRMITTTYKVLVDDNYHYMDPSERYEFGRFESLEAALQACKGIVDDFLAEHHRPGMTKEELYGLYVHFGEDPFIVGGEGGRTHFSAWQYAEQRCRAMCEGDDKGGDA